MDRDEYLRRREDITKRQLSNSDNFDKAVLALSTSAVGLSALFGGSIPKTAGAFAAGVLVGALWLFSVSIVSTAVSIGASQRGHATLLAELDKEYSNSPNQCVCVSNMWSNVTAWFNRIALIAFVLAIFCTAAGATAIIL